MCLWVTCDEDTLGEGVDNAPNSERYGNNYVCNEIQATTITIKDNFITKHIFEFENNNLKNVELETKEDIDNELMKEDLLKIIHLLKLK